MKGKARTHPDIFRMVLGPCAQFYPFEASEQKWSQTPKSKPKDFVTYRFAIEKKVCQNRMKNNGVMPIRRLRKKVAVGLFWAQSWLFLGLK